METQSARHRMVEIQIAKRGVRDQRVLDAMKDVPREEFVAREIQHRAYDDSPLPIGFGQTISQPYVVARMCEMAGLEGDEHVLEVGAGSGYQTAILASLVRRVTSVEIVPELARRAAKHLEHLGFENACVLLSDGSAGASAHAPYDAILVSAGAPRVPTLLVDQLSDGGRLVLPVGERARQRLCRITRHSHDYDVVYDTAVRFVDLVGKYGWGGIGAPQA